jgi:hypothetical protein
MPVGNVSLTKPFDCAVASAKTKLSSNGFRSAAKQSFDALERGDYVTLRSDRDTAEFMRQIGEQASVGQSAAHRD